MLLQDELKACEHNLLSGRVDTMEQYKYLLGSRAAFQRAVEIVKKADQPEEDDGPMESGDPNNFDYN